VLHIGNNQLEFQNHFKINEIGLALYLSSASAQFRLPSLQSVISLILEVSRRKLEINRHLDS
jgi:hypothetical protein